MPLPGTITACTPRKNIESLFTHVADAMTMRPVDRSTATIDQVALATDGNRTRNRKRILFIGQLRGSFSALRTPHSALSRLDPRSLFHQRFDLRYLTRRETDPLESLVSDDVVVLDANAGILVLLHSSTHGGDEGAILRRVRQNVECATADVDPRLDREGVADLVRALAEVRLRRIVHREAESVRDAVDHPEIR